jgi:hypothetical protein
MKGIIEVSSHKTTESAVNFAIGSKDCPGVTPAIISPMITMKNITAQQELLLDITNSGHKQTLIVF